MWLDTRHIPTWTIDFGENFPFRKKKSMFIPIESVCDMAIFCEKRHFCQNSMLS